MVTQQEVQTQVDIVSYILMVTSNWPSALASYMNKSSYTVCLSQVDIRLIIPAYIDFKIYNYLQVDNLLRYSEMKSLRQSLLLWYLKIGPIHVVTYYCHYKYILLALLGGHQERL